MICLDTNIFIYLAVQKLPSEVVSGTDLGYPSMVRVEALGYYRISAAEEQALTRLFAESEEYFLTKAVIGRAVELRQAKRLGLGDAIIAAAALEHGCPLWTANTADFAQIADLQVVNPLEQ